MLLTGAVSNWETNDVSCHKVKFSHRMQKFSSLWNIINKVNIFVTSGFTFG